MKMKQSICTSGVFLTGLYLMLFNMVNSDQNVAIINNPVGTFQQLNAWPDFQIAAFTDLNADRRMDIIFTNGDGTKLFAVIQPGTKGFQFASSTPTSINFAPPIEIMGHVLSKPIRSVATADFNGDSRTDLLLVTSDSDTGPFEVYIAYGLKSENRGKFDKPQLVDTFSSQPLVCDLNSDMIADLYGETPKRERVAYLGGQMITRVSASYYGPSWSQLGYSAFGDVNGDGIPVHHSTYIYQVTVLNGLCSSPDVCSDGRLPYGLPVTGISSELDTEAATGGRQLSSSLLSSQSCCSALQVPFEILGLGPFANYVEKLTISIPPSKTAIRSRLLSFIVPKAQIVINPFPLDNPSAWTMKLFLQPLYNMKVLYIAITLLCVCILLLIIIGILQWFEFREDRLEKQKESQRFHFDAM
ncbi:unnamed protein product [Heterobilharzia americana]|nr:unnamed protein product [Heterobilharzia americana]